MQQVLLRLSDFWESVGCVITQPMNTEVGAGTLNPATSLRVLGPEPWSVAYVEPSVRPDDSRYGDNPNRLQTHTQFQVILKPEPGNPQELYLQSLRAIGIDLDAHDIRFVEDNWAFPAFGAWGLGWEVWLDGLEITQFTYFQHAGGRAADPVSVELTYGIERIVMALHNVTNFKDIKYSDSLTYGELLGQSEYEYSRYYLDEANIDSQRQLFDIYEAQAQELITRRLPIPAYNYACKCSHTFNVLDARGAVSTTDRARTFARMRALISQITDLWLERREELGYPLLTDPPQVAQMAEAELPVIEKPETFALEIGVEELPAAVAAAAVGQVEKALIHALDASRLEHGPVKVCVTPRRIIALVEQVAVSESDYQTTARGPRASAAYDTEGQPTRAALGFARKHKVDVSQLEKITVDNVEYVGLSQTMAGRSAAEVMTAIIPQLIDAVKAEKQMRWSAPGLSFSRPIRYLLALLGEQVIPVQVSTMVASRTTLVLRTDPAPSVEVPSADALLPTLAEHGIMADHRQRREDILQQARELAQGRGGVVNIETEAAVLEEITFLVEAPVAISGSIDEAYLQLPDNILISVMRKHQRYIPVRDDSDALLPYFITIANGPCDADAVRAGNQAVLRARFEDALFFWRNDVKKPLAELAQGLHTIAFAEGLGSMADRVARIAHCAAGLTAMSPVAIDTPAADAALAGPSVLLDADDRAVMQRASELIKFDLGSQMVMEMSSLAGYMAKEYALQAGESPQVATALVEMELPRPGSNVIPDSVPGAVLALSDRLDMLTSLFSIGAEPTGSSDPFALRRAALAAVVLAARHPAFADLNLTDAWQRFASIHLDDSVALRLKDFIARRFEQYAVETGLPIHAVRAVSVLGDYPGRALLVAAQYQQLQNSELFRTLAEAIARVSRIAKSATGAGYDPAALVVPAEIGLHQAYKDAKAARQAYSGSFIDLQTFVELHQGLVGPITTFFDQVLVMDDDMAVRTNRLGLLRSISDLGEGIIDWASL